MNYKGPVPDIENCLPCQMSESKRNDLEKWYAERVQFDFDMEHKLYIYTRADVCLLQMGVMKFSSLMREITSQDGCEIDPMKNLTLASFA